MILDSDIADLYKVETKRINEAVKNNPDKFPEGYIVSLTSEEWSDLKSKISTSSWGGKNKLPNAFSERALYMLATILKSPVATETTLAIIETFAKVRELSRTIADLHRHDEEKQKSMLQKSGEIVIAVRIVRHIDGQHLRLFLFGQSEQRLYLVKLVHIEQKIFHAEIVVDNAKVAAEPKAYQKLPVVADFTDENGNDTMQEMIDYNYNQINPVFCKCSSLRWITLSFSTRCISLMR